MMKNINQIKSYDIYLLLASCKLPIVFCLLLMANCLLPIGSYAQTQKSLTVEDAINTSLKNNLQIQSSQLNVQSYSKLKNSSFGLPKTEINYQWGQLNSINKDNSFQIAQNIPFPTYYSARSGLYKAEYKNSELRQQATASEIKARVRLLFYRLQYLQNARSKLQQLDSLYANFASIALLRYNTGETNLLERTTTEAKRNEVALMLKQAETEYSSTYVSLKTLMNSNENFEVSETFEPLTLTATLDTTAILQNPSLQMMYQQAVIAEKNKKLELAQTLPDFNVGYFNQSIIGFQNTNGNDVYYGSSDRFTGFNVGLNIPITFFSNNSRIKSLRLQQQSLQKEADNSKLVLQNELQNAFLQYEQYLSQYNLYRTSSLQNAESIINTATLGFRNGEIGYLEYASALQTATDVQLRFLQSINQINQSVININLLLNTQ